MTIRQVGSPTEFGDGSSSSATGTRTCSAGSMLVLTVQSSANLTATPSGWTLAKKQTCSDSPGYQTNIFFQTNVGAGSLSVTVARSGTGVLRGTISEWAGMGSATVDKTSGFGSYANGSSTAFTTTGTLAASTELAIASFYAAASAGDTLTGPSGWSTISTANSPVEYLTSVLITSSATGLTPYWGTGANVENANALVTFLPGAPPPAAVLSGMAHPVVTATTAQISITSTVATGGLFFVATQTNTAPSAAQIEAGTDAANFPGVAATGTPIVGTTTVTITGLTASVTYYVWVVQDNGSLSNIPSTSFTTLPPPPAITSVDNLSPLYQGSLTINFENGGASAGTVTIGGVSQTVTTWTSLHAVITSVARGTNKYGVPLNVVVTSAIGSPSDPFALTQLLPQSGWGYTDLGPPISPSSEGFTASPPIVSSDQAAYDTRVAKVLMYPDGSARVDPALLSGGTGTWEVEAWTSGSGWGAQGLQSISEAGGGGGTTFVADFFGAVSSSIGSVFGAVLSSLSRTF